MPSYLQRLDDYSRYDSIFQFIKYAAMTDEQAASTLFNLLPTSAQQTLRRDPRIGPSGVPDLQLLQAWAYANPQEAKPMWMHIFREALQTAGGHNSELMSSPGMQALYNQHIKAKVEEDTWQKQIGRGLGNWTPDMFLEKTFQDTFGPQASQNAPTSNVATQQTTGENPSMWNYMMPALAVGAPLALLGGLGGGGKTGLGLLGLAALGGLGYGFARQNGWINGWEPVENFANTVNSWEPVKNVTDTVSGWVNNFTNPQPTQQSTQTPPATQTTTPATTTPTPAPAPAATTPAPAPAPAQPAPTAQNTQTGSTNKQIAATNPPVSSGGGAYATTFKQAFLEKQTFLERLEL